MPILYRILFLFLAIQILFSPGPVYAASGAMPSVPVAPVQASIVLPERVIKPMTALDALTLYAEGVTVRLWGVRSVVTADGIFDLQALDALDSLNDGQPINCRIVAGDLTRMVGRCNTSTNEDLALNLLKDGYVVMDRRQVTGTPFEATYAGAQESARVKGRGVWRAVRDMSLSDNSPEWLKRNHDMIMLSTMIVGPICGFMLLAFILYIGFKKLHAGQENEALRARRQEEILKDREASVLVSTLEGELAENKDRIEAFIMIYRDMLRSLKDPAEVARYQESGDTVQKHPVCSRVVFDASVGKLSLLDIKLASLVSKLYAALPHDQQYINLDPGTPVDTSIRVVEKVVQEAEALLPQVDHVIQELQKPNQ